MKKNIFNTAVELSNPLFIFFFFLFASLPNLPLNGEKKKKIKLKAIFLPTQSITKTDVNRINSIFSQKKKKKKYTIAYEKFPERWICKATWNELFSILKKILNLSKTSKIFSVHSGYTDFSIFNLNTKHDVRKICIYLYRFLNK